jgi:hypothetical protein
MTRKCAKKECGDRNLPRKAANWLDKIKQPFVDLVLSIFHPIARSRLEKYVAYIYFEEVESGMDGMQFVSADAKKIESFPSSQAVDIRDLYNDDTKGNDDLIGVAVIAFKSAKTGKILGMMQSIDMGQYLNLLDVQKIAEENLIRQHAIISELNKGVPPVNVE